jgi:hypothetical protein
MSHPLHFSHALAGNVLAHQNRRIFMQCPTEKQLQDDPRTVVQQRTAQW